MGRAAVDSDLVAMRLLNAIIWEASLAVAGIARVVEAIVS
jgi:hypothetical protein